MERKRCRNEEELCFFFVGHTVKSCMTVIKFFDGVLPEELLTLFLLQGGISCDSLVSAR